MKDLPKFGIVRLRHYIYIFDVSIWCMHDRSFVYKRI